MKIAVVGGGISGLGAAYVLQQGHDVTLFESGATVGGHAQTSDVQAGGKRHAVDTGFVVYNDTTYPNFSRLLAQLGVRTQPTQMTFSVRCLRRGLEFAGSSLSSFFAQRSNIFRRRHHRLLRDMMRFHKEATAAADRTDNPPTLGEYLRRSVPSDDLRDLYVVPLIAAIWSHDPTMVDDFPTDFFLRFATRHRLLQVHDRLQWRVVSDGSREYVRALTDRLQATVRTDCVVSGVRRESDRVALTVDGETLDFDEVVLAVHADQALRMLSDADEREREILAALPYRLNRAVLHRDSDVLPRSKRARANWNYEIDGDASKPVTTYDMCGLQSLESSEPILVTLNPAAAMREDRVWEQLDYEHPVYSPAAVAAQQRWEEISGRRRTHFCGAYWGYGFHEDGLTSALQVGRRFGLALT